MQPTIYVMVNYNACGWCRKLKPVLTAVVRSMNPRAAAQVEVVELDTPEGRVKKTELQFSGGIPCIIALDSRGQQVVKEPGYKDTNKLSKLFLDIWAKHGTGQI